MVVVEVMVVVMVVVVVVVEAVVEVAVVVVVAAAAAPAAAAPGVKGIFDFLLSFRLALSCHSTIAVMNTGDSLFTHTPFRTDYNSSDLQ